VSGAGAFGARLVARAAGVLLLGSSGSRRRSRGPPRRRANRARSRPVDSALEAARVLFRSGRIDSAAVTLRAALAADSGAASPQRLEHFRLTLDNYAHCEITFR